MAEILPTANACDCHVHIIGPKVRFPLATPRSYTPVDAPLPDLEAMMARLGLERAVIVQPSIYGSDNACTLDALDRLGPKARAVAVLGPRTPLSMLDDLDQRGVRGLRVNIVSHGTKSTAEIRDELRAAADLCARNNWHVQAFVSASALETIAPLVRELPVPVVFDHFAMVPPREADGPAADTVCRLLEEGRAWVKLSGSYRLADNPFDPALDRLAARYAAANPNHLVWASDWPHTPEHTGISGGDERELPYRDMDTRGLLGLFDRWVGEAHRERILVTNPARLYGFT
ncbi:amidohydrolase family protein [Aquabacter sp. CN5-332]|uniref:amidohydrolase family protein n=1 Tax=Aquabacter sp. CN5-332 TaxID=3156608 RepID=UPI0032B46939